MLTIRLLSICDRDNHSRTCTCCGFYHFGVSVKIVRGRMCSRLTKLLGLCTPIHWDSSAIDAE
jgi:hypothetical protein